MTTVAAVSVRALLSVDYISGREIPCRNLVNVSSAVAKVSCSHVSPTHLRPRSPKSPSGSLTVPPPLSSLKDRHTLFLSLSLSVSVSVWGEAGGRTVRSFRLQTPESFPGGKRASQCMNVQRGWWLKRLAAYWIKHSCRKVLWSHTFFCFFFFNEITLTALDRRPSLNMVPYANPVNQHECIRQHLARHYQCLVRRWSAFTQSW